MNKKRNDFVYGIFNKKGKIVDILPERRLAIFLLKKDALKRKLEEEKVHKIYLEKLQEVFK